METEKLFQSKLFKGIILGGALFLLVMLIFCVGIFVGAERANFSFAWAADYHRNFGGPESGFIGQMLSQNYIGANGVFGQIIKSDSTVPGQTALTIRGADSVERIILADKETTIMLQRKNIEISELENGENVVVIGEPNNQGQILAELIRIMPNINPPPKLQKPN